MTFDLDSWLAGLSWHFPVRVRGSKSYVRVHGHRTKNVAKAVGATSSENFRACNEWWWCCCLMMCLCYRCRAVGKHASQLFRMSTCCYLGFSHIHVWLRHLPSVWLHRYANAYVRLHWRYTVFSYSVGGRGGAEPGHLIPQFASRKGQKNILLRFVKLFLLFVFGKICHYQRHSMVVEEVWFTASFGLPVRLSVCLFSARYLKNRCS